MPFCLVQKALLPIYIDVPCMHIGDYEECNPPYTLHIHSLPLTPWQGRVGPGTDY